MKFFGTQLTHNGQEILDEGNFSLPIASTTTLGGVKQGTNITIDADGTINASASGSSSSFVIKQEMFVIAGGQTSFSLIEGTYTPHTNTIFWFTNGVKQDSSALGETSETTFTIPSGLPDGTEILVEYWQVTGNAPSIGSHAYTHLPTGDDALPLASGSTAGLMSSVDKTKLDNLTTTPIATESTDGLMSSADKTKLNSLNTNTATQDTNGLMSFSDKYKLDVLTTATATTTKNGYMSASDKQQLTDAVNDISTINGEIDTINNNYLTLNNNVTKMNNIKTALITTTWTGSVAPYSQTILIDGITIDDAPLICPVYSTDNATLILEEKAWSCVSKIETQNNAIVVTCSKNKPITAINIQIKGV